MVENHTYQINLYIVEIWPRIKALLLFCSMAVFSSA